jgi:TRAP-type mannitol/chloroaromatic compound transport system substrate-binding protein
MTKSPAIVGIVGVLVGLLVGSFIFAGKTETDGQVTTVADSDATSETAEKVRWKMASSFSGQLILAGTMGKELEAQVAKLSNDEIELKFFDPGALVPALEIFDAVSAGAVNAGWSTPGFWAGKVPALQFFSAVPFGPSAGEMVAWMYHGGGLELMQEIYARYNIYSQPCMLIPPEGAGWFTREINSIEELKGLKMRFFGLGAKVMEKIGVSTQLIAAGDIFPALELGTIDATEFSLPAIDLDLGFHAVAKHYYFPGWHQPSTMGELMINLPNWNTLSEQQQTVINEACRSNMLKSYAEGEAIQFPALQELQAQGVTLHRWPDETIEVFRAAWEEVVVEEAANDPEFAKVLASLTEFRENYKVWGDLGYLD